MALSKFMACTICAVAVVQPRQLCRRHGERADAHASDADSATQRIRTARCLKATAPQPRSPIIRKYASRA